jgi:hypothetical protein
MRSGSITDSLLLGSLTERIPYTSIPVRARDSGVQHQRDMNMIGNERDFVDVELFLNVQSRAVPACTMGIFLLYLTGQLWVLMRGIEASCGYFGAFQEEIGWTTVLRTFVFAFLGLVVYLSRGQTHFDRACTMVPNRQSIQ